VKNKNKLILVIAVVAIIFVSWYVWRWVSDYYAVKNFSVASEQELRELLKTDADYIRLERIAKLAYQRDNYGSTTPEGTLELFVEALKKGDADLASKYFLPELQKEYRTAVENWVRLGKNIGIADNLSRVDMPEIKGNSAFITTTNSKKEIILMIRLAKNQYTQKWKLESI